MIRHKQLASLRRLVMAPAAHALAAPPGASAAPGDLELSAEAKRRRAPRKTRRG